MTAKAGPKAAANKAVTSKTTREAASAEAAVETPAASERQGIGRNCVFLGRTYSNQQPTCGCCNDPQY